MTYLLAFLFSGFVCLICQIIMDNTKLTYGHITSGATVIGVILSFLGIYDDFLDKCGAGASVLISNFGHSLYQAGLRGYTESGFLGVLTNILSNSGVAIVSVIISSFVFTLLFKAKD